MPEHRGPPFHGRIMETEIVRGSFREEGFAGAAGATFSFVVEIPLGGCGRDRSAWVLRRAKNARPQDGSPYGRGEPDFIDCRLRQHFNGETAIFCCALTARLKSCPFSTNALRNIWLCLSTAAHLFMAA